MLLIIRKLRLTGLLVFIFSVNLNAQVVRLEPTKPSLNDTIKIIFNAAEGNEGLKDYNGDVYIHTGLITDKSNDIHSWKHVIGEWGQEVESLKLKPLGNNLFEYELVITDFYGLRGDEIVQQIAIVFRNGDGTIVGKTSDDNDFVVPVNGYIPPAFSVDEYLVEKRLYISHTINNNSLIIETDKGRVDITPFRENIIQIKHLSVNESKSDSSVAVILEPQNIAFSIEENDNNLNVKCGLFALKISKNPLQIRTLYKNELIIEEENGYYEKTKSKGLRFKIGENEKFFGLGERAINFALNGNKYQLYNKPFYGYEIGAKDLNYSVPLLYSTNKYMVFFDNPQKGWVDIGCTEPDVLSVETIGGTSNYIIISDENYESITADYFRLTGKQPMPPRWAFGNLMSRMAYKTQKETDSIVSLMLEKKFPIDAVILDFYWFGDSIKGTMGRLKWYKPNWPEPEKMIQNFKSKGINTILITEPYVLDSVENFSALNKKGLLAKNKSGETYIDYGFYFGYGGLIDIFNPEAGQWFWEQYKKQIEKGVAAWWGDLGEPESHPWDMYHVNGTADEVHNIYGHYWHKMLFENYKNTYPDVRLFNLNRAGYAGSQRYSIFPWTGDVARSWGGYQAQLPLMLHMSISGLPYIHADAGGFSQGVLDEELYIRWLQFACFTPVLRPHGSGLPSEPVFYSDSTQDIVRKYMNLRYSLLPYIYTNAWETAADGELMVKPLFFEEKGHIQDLTEQKGYFFGDDIVVFPVMEKGTKQMNIELPQGNWYRFTDNNYYADNSISINTPIEDMPVFVKSGSFIPTVMPAKNTEQYSSELLKVNYYFDTDIHEAGYTMYEDDGKTNLSWEKNQFELITFKYSGHDGNHKFSIDNNEGKYNGKPDKRWIELRIIGFNETPQSILLDNKMVKQLESKKEMGSNSSGFFYDKNNVLTIRFKADYSNQTVYLK